MRSYADNLIGKAYAELIYQVLEINDKPMRCKEISKEISEHSDFPTLSPQYVRQRMNYMLRKGEIVRIEEHIPYSRRKTIYFALSSVAKKKEETTPAGVSDFITGIAGGVKAFVIGEDGSVTKTFEF